MARAWWNSSNGFLRVLPAERIFGFGSSTFIPTAFPGSFLPSWRLTLEFFLTWTSPSNTRPFPSFVKWARSGDAQTYLDLIAEIRDRLPNSVIRSTFLVGHPGEGHREFEELRRFQEAGNLDWLGVFSWSREEGTSAAKEKSGLAARLAAPAAERRRKAIESVSSASAEGVSTNGRGIGWMFSLRNPSPTKSAPSEGLLSGSGGGWLCRRSRGWREFKRIRSGDVVKVRITGRTGLDLQGAWDG